MQLVEERLMVDISKCTNPYCAIKDTCFRYLSECDDYQSFIVVDKKVDTSDDCDHYWKVNTKEEVDELNKTWY